MTITIGDNLRVALTGSGPQSGVWQNVWHYRMTAGAGIAEADVLPAVEINYTLAWNTISSVISDQYSAHTLELWSYNMSTHKWEGQDIEGVALLSGQSAAEPLAPGVANVGFFTTEVKRRQGRTFLPGIIVTETDDGLFKTNTVTKMGLYMAQFVNDLTPTGGTLTLSTFNLDTTSIYYETHSAYAGVVTVTNVPAYQRRRKQGVGI